MSRFETQMEKFVGINISFNAIGRRANKDFFFIFRSFLNGSFDATKI